MVFALASVIVWGRRSEASRPVPTRLYLNLRRACQRAGIEVPAGLTPLALVGRVRTLHESAADPAGRVVELYLRHRYGGEALRDTDLREMRQALGAVRTRLKRHD